MASHTDMPDKLLDQMTERIRRLERILQRLDNNAAPTLPIYDLTAPSIGAIIVPYKYSLNGGPDIRLNTDIEYLFELNFDEANNETSLYIDSNFEYTFVNQSSSGPPQPFDRLDFGFATETTDPTQVIGVYLRDLRVGSTRLGSDIFADDLSVAPTAPPYQFVDAVSGIVVVNGHTYTRLDDLSPSTEPDMTTSGFGNQSFAWVTFRLYVPAVIDGVVNFPYVRQITDGTSPFQVYLRLGFGYSAFSRFAGEGLL